MSDTGETGDRRYREAQFAMTGLTPADAHIAEALAHNIGGPTAVSGLTIPEGPGANGE
jgi:hypothetical protein